MSRWEYDSVLYRVFCVTLLGVAVTFTVILTNVFVDIDRRASDKVTPKPESMNSDLSELSRVINVNMLPEDKSEDVYEDKDYQDSNDLYRSKRSLETPDRIFHIKDPKMKKLLTTHLTNLLDELDERENKNKNSPNLINDYKANTEKLESKSKDKYTGDNFAEDKNKSKGEIELKDNEDLSRRDVENNDLNKDYKAELLHLAMHNVILQGIIDNTDLDNVYKKVAELVKDFENDHSKLNKDELKNLFKNMKHSEKRTGVSKGKSSDESGNSHNFKTRTSDKETSTDYNTLQRTTTRKPKDHNVIIKTTIDITAISNEKANKEGDLNAKDKVNGVIKLIYNGNTIKFKRMDDDSYNNSHKVFGKLDNKDNHNTEIPNSYFNTNNQSYYQKVFYNYLKKLKAPESFEQGKILSSKRLKRHIKIRFDNNKTTVKPKTKKDDDELFVEIETHFDSKGTKGEKKKKLIRDLIQKIQSAIHSDNNGHKNKVKHWHVKKRIQDPLGSKSATALINKLILPLETLAHRHLDPISKSVPAHEEMPLITSVFGSNQWDKPYQDPRFLVKNINSAEMNTLDTDYKKVMRHNGIPQRLQKPLNTDMSDEIFQDSKVADFGNIKFLMKDIEGTGFSIGFNQYTDEAPDAETMKLFSGLENIIQTYHQQYDQESTIENRGENNPSNVKNILPHNLIEDEEERERYDQHIIRRRSIHDSTEKDIHLNNYKIVYGHDLLPNKDHNDIFNSGKYKTSKAINMKMYKKKNHKKNTFIIDENVFEKDLKPSEILSIADLLQRKKRSIKVKKISNVKIKSKMNRFLNPNNMAAKSLFMNKKQTRRTKRQIEKIRIIARDLPHHDKSEEENVFVVSDEKMFADRALVREVEVPELEPNDKMPSLEHEEVILPQKEEEPFDSLSQAQKINDDHEDQFDLINPYLYDVNLFENHNEFNRRARHNSLMSKYPHIIMEDSPNYMNNGEEFMLDNIQPQPFGLEATTEPSIVPTILDINSPNDQEITDLISPPKDHSNYRVSVKIRPKNSTNMSGFKEVHTSINKSYNKNGLTYTSLVNVSQVSKVEKLNKTISRRENDENTQEQKINLKQQQELIKSLIQQHKHRLDMQLKHLQIEKQKLDAMYIENTESRSENNQSNAEQPKADRNKENKPILRKTRKLIKDDARKKSNQETTTTETATEAATPESKTTRPKETKTDDSIKTKMIETIERNENITNELLKKIDQNTGVLKIFLGKLIATIETPVRKATEMAVSKVEESNQDQVVNNESITKQPPPKDVNVDKHIPFNFEDYHYVPNLLLKNMPRNTNDSYGIPFVYAVQHPYRGSPNKDSMASMIYHGHIHTNTVSDMKREMQPSIQLVLKEKVKVLPEKKLDTEFWKPKPGEKVLHDFVVSKNNSRFFLDDTGSDFTAVPVSETGKGIFPLNFNGTKI